MLNLPNTKRPTKNGSTKTKLSSPTTRKATLPSHLGGGSYNITIPGTITKSKRGTGGVKSEPGKERDHIVPVSLGGTSDKDNIRVTGDNPAELETQVWKDYEAGKLTLGQARLKILTYKQNREKVFGIDEKDTSVGRNFFKSLGPTIKNFAKDAFQSVGRSAVSVSMDITKEKERTPTGPVERFFLGKDIVKPASQRVAENELTIKDTLPNKYDKLALPAAFAGVVGSIAADVVPGGKPGKSVVSYINKSNKKVFTELTEAELKVLRNEVKNIPTAKGGYQIHLDADTPQLRSNAQQISRTEFLSGHPQAKEVFTNASKGQRYIKQPNGKFAGSEAGFIKAPDIMDTKVGESLYPIKSTDEATQKAFQKWDRKTLAAKQLGTIDATKVKGNFDDILKYESGGNNPQLKSYFDEMHELANTRGLPTGYRSNYVMQVYKNDPDEVTEAMAKYLKDKGVPDQIIRNYVDGKDVPDVIAKRFQLTPGFSKQRVFPDYKTAMEYGLKPKYKTIPEIAGHYREQLESTVANKEFLDTLIKQKKLVNSFDATSDMIAVDLPFSPKGYYAKPEFAKVLNGLFRNEATLGIGQKSLKLAADTSRFAQKMVLSGGLPKSNVNFFAIGQLVKELTSGNLKAIPAFVRSNVNPWSISYFRKEQQTLLEMANQGIDVGNNIGAYDQAYKGFLDNKGFKEVIGDGFSKLFDEKTFASFIPQLQIETFKSAKLKGLKKGMLPSEAQEFAAEVVRASHGIFENVGRSKGTEDFLSAAFLAPKFREGIVNTLLNTAKSVSTEIRNPAYYKNRRLFAGMVITYGAYNALNKKLNGHYMWENEAGHESELMLEREDGEIIYIPFMPSFTAFPRALASAGINLAKGDFKTAGNKIGSLFSIPVKTTIELVNNRDYFNDAIWEDSDSKLDKLRKIAAYAGLAILHPFPRELLKHFQKDKPWHQTVARMMELPMKFSSRERIETDKFYRELEAQDAEKKKVREAFRPTYDEIRTLVNEGRTGEAKELVDSLSDEDYELYKNMKQSEKAKATRAKNLEKSLNLPSQ